MRVAVKLYSAIALTGVLYLVSGCSNVTLAQQQPESPNYRIVILHMSADGDTHRVLSANIVSSAVPLTVAPTMVDSSALNFVVTDVGGKQLLEGGIDDPAIIRSPLSLPGEPQQGHKIVALPQTEYFLRVPYQPSMKFLHLQKGKKPVVGNASKSSNTVDAANSNNTRIDLAPWLQTQVK